MNLLNPTELEFAEWLALIAPANPTPRQSELLEKVLLAFLQKTMALDVLSLEHARTRVHLGDLQRNIGHALAHSMAVDSRPLERMPVPTSGQPAILKPTPPRLTVVRNTEAKKAFDVAVGIARSSPRHCIECGLSSGHSLACSHSPLFERPEGA